MGTTYEVIELPAEPTVTAPDGSDVRVLLTVAGRGSMAHFELAAGQVSIAVRHRTVAEVWYFLSGTGEMWLRPGADPAGDVVRVAAGTCLAIPPGTEFQFRSGHDAALAAVAVTMPPWPGTGEAEPVDGNPRWSPTVRPGPT
jgi:mannose-6-phosphate isomerase-like protein (cupin superfamily)